MDSEDFSDLPPPSRDESASLLAEQVIHAELETQRYPHVVVCRLAGTVILMGPYPDGVAALVAADEEERLTGGDKEVRFSVAPIYPGLTGT